MASDSLYTGQRKTFYRLFVFKFADGTSYSKSQKAAIFAKATCVSALWAGCQTAQQSIHNTNPQKRSLLDTNRNVTDNE